MASATGLPSVLQHKLTILSSRVRRLQALRRASQALLVLLGTAALGVGLDAWLELPAWVRGGFLAVWLLSGGLLGFACLRPLQRRLDAESLAALIEEKYPELAERLTSSVELIGGHGTHGSPALVALLLQETEARTGALNVLPAFPARSAATLTGLAAGGLFLAVAPALLWPSRYGELARRFFTPWHDPAAVVRFDLVVRPGNTLAAKGRPLTVTVEVRPRYGEAGLPDSCTLVYTDNAGKTARRRMLLERADTFALHLEAVTGDLTYHAEAGRVSSDTFRITAVDPVELAPDSPTITITPPAYAKAAVDEETLHGLVDLTALQHSRIRLQCQFTRPAVAAWLEWTSAGKEAPASSPLQLTADGLSGTVELPALEEGSYRLLLSGSAAGEAALTTELGPRVLSVVVDQPPAFLKVNGTPETLKSVLAFDQLPLEVVVADDLAVARASVEIRVNDSTPDVEPMKLDEPNARQTTGRHVLRLADRKLKEGDLLHYRLLVADGRDVPEAGLTPNVTYYPPYRWLTLQVASDAEPLQQQQITAQRDQIQKRLEALQADLQRQQRALYRLRQEVRNQESLSKDQADDLANVRQQNLTAENALRELAREAAVTPGLQPLADRAADIAEQELHRTSQSLHAADQATRPEPRDNQLKQADSELTAALRRLEELRRMNDQLAQARLDQVQLNLLAERQRGLAEQTTMDVQSDSLQQQQEELANDLKELTEQSEPLRQALQQLTTEQIRQLANRARDLAQAQRQLQDATQATHEGPPAELARKQQQLAEKIQQLARVTQTATQAAKAAPLKPDAARQAAEALQQQDLSKALQQQDQAARELEQAAANILNAEQLGRDPKEAARQLARLQEAVRQQMKERVQKADPKQPLAKQLLDLQQEQDAIQQAVESLQVPPTTQPTQVEAATKARQARTALAKPDPAEASSRMKEARDALNRLADQVQPLEQRQRQAREEAARLRKEQDTIARQVEQSKLDEPGAVEKRAAVAKRQADAAEQLAKLDALDHAVRKDQAQAALNKALRDLLDGKADQAAASQQEAQRQLERLEQALNQKESANAPPDEPQSQAELNDLPPQATAQELARKQRQLATATARARSHLGEPARQALQQVRQQQRQLNEQAAQLPVQQGQRALADARTAMQQALEALTKSDAPRAQQKQDEAAQALERLARQAKERSAAPRPRPEEPTARPQGLPTSQQAEQARQLAREQRELREATQKLARQVAEQIQAPDSPLSKQLRRQEQLQDQTRQLRHDLERLAQQNGLPPPQQQAAQQALTSTHKAVEAMHQAACRQCEANAGQAGENQRQAAQQLEQAAQQLGQAAGEQAGAGAPTGQAVRQAQAQMGQAQARLRQGENPAARQAMQQAAQALQQAAQQLAQQGAQQPGRPNLPTQPPREGAAGGGVPDLRQFEADIRKYPGKRWGELPGELRTKIVQDLKARYGDDYARIIKLYFEQLADTKQR